MNSSFNIIKQSNILEKNDFKTLYNLEDELQDVFLHSQIFRTKTEMEISVLNDIKHPTADSKYWQAMREQSVMFNELVMLSYEYRKNKVEIEKLKRQLNNEKDDLEKELIQIEIEKKQYISLNQERNAKDRIRELNEWHNIKIKLIPDMKYSRTDVNEHQLVSYTKKWINQLPGLEYGSPSEKANLIGQLDKGIKMCKERGCIKEIKNGENENIKKLLD
jgi:hypothetical protein